ncbi:MAG TPA: hypothetical protein VHK63_00785 [Candidatus Limnocylindria bacterium]|nr:hypothetical protein [Candidatus Limnocylindria bacterium]
MHDYTIGAIHRDRMAQLEAEADGYRLVRAAVAQRPKRRGLGEVTALLASQLGDARRIVIARRRLGHG